MAGARFDILFAGELIKDADPEAARRQLQQHFNLSDEAVERLFSGRKVAVKRGVDTATASRYRELFRDAGTLVQVRPIKAPPQAPPVPPTQPVSAPAEARPERPTGFEQAKPPVWTATEPKAPSGQTVFVEDASEMGPGELSLVPGQNWTLEDCQPRPAPAHVSDTSHLELVTLAPEGDQERKD